MKTKTDSELAKHPGLAVHYPFWITYQFKGDAHEWRMWFSSRWDREEFRWVMGLLVDWVGEGGEDNVA